MVLKIYNIGYIGSSGPNISYQNASIYGDKCKVKILVNNKIVYEGEIEDKNIIMGHIDPYPWTSLKIEGIGIIYKQEHIFEAKLEVELDPTKTQIILVKETFYDH